MNGPNFTRKEFAGLFLETASHLSSIENYRCDDISIIERKKIKAKVRRIEDRLYKLSKEIEGND